MESIYENFNLSGMDSSENCPSPTEPETENDVYVNTQQQCETSKKSPASTSLNNKIIIPALALLVLATSISLCAVGIMYYNTVVSTEILREKYENATAMLIVLEHKAKEKESTYEMQMVKYQEIISACNETKRQLGPKHQELISICGETKQLHEMVKVKYEQAHDRLSVCNANQNCNLCEEGWKSLGLKCYYFSTEKLNWAQSRDYCVEKGGQLVIITRQTEQSFVSSQIEETHWIGMNDLESEGEWLWVNKQPVKETGVTFWFNAPEGPHEPDNWKKEDPSGENCAALGNEVGDIDKWFDASCHKRKKCICEK